MVRVLAQIGYRDDVRQFFKQFRILTLPSQYIYDSLLYFHQNRDGYRRAEQVHRHDTRYRCDFRPEFLRLGTSWNATLHYAPTFFNKLPVGIRELPFKKFKVVIKKYLLSEAFYSHSEFLNCNIDKQNLTL